jgi:hypothetical protein
VSAPRRFSGRLGIAALFALGGALTLWAILWWRTPSNSVGWSFTQLHSSLLRKKREQAAQFVAPRVRYSGEEMDRERFLSAYVLPPKPGELAKAPCPAAAGHWVVAMDGRAYCFVRAEHSWQLHQVGEAPCGCR